MSALRTDQVQSQTHDNSSCRWNLPLRLKQVVPTSKSSLLVTKFSTVLNSSHTSTFRRFRMPLHTRQNNTTCRLQLIQRRICKVHLYKMSTRVPILFIHHPHMMQSPIHFVLPKKRSTQCISVRDVRMFIFAK